MCIHGAYNKIFANTITDSNYDGIGLHGAFNIIFGNNITNSNYDGIHIYDSVYNTVFHNNLFNNTLQARQSDSSSTLDEGYPSGGNYWSDYRGIDEYSGVNQDTLGSDGMGDTPYVIDENNRDNYPLMAPFVISDNDDPILPAAEAFPIMQVVIASLIFAVIGLGLFAYFKKYGSSNKV